MRGSHVVVQEAGTEIMGVPAATLRDMSSGDEKEFYSYVMGKVHKPYVLKIKVAEETYQQETRIKKTIIRYILLVSPPFCS